MRYTVDHRSKYISWKGEEPFGRLSTGREHAVDKDIKDRHVTRAESEKMREGKAVSEVNLERSAVAKGGRALKTKLKT